MKSKVKFGGYITDQNKMCMKFLWGAYQIHLGGISDTKTPLNAAEKLMFFAPKLILNYFKTILKPTFSVEKTFRNCIFRCFLS